MKKIIAIVTVFMIIKSADAQVMQSRAQWATLKIPQLKCWECKNKLEQYLLREKGPNDDAGIVRWTISMPAATMRIQYVPDRITLDYIRTAVANAGFDVDTMKANEDSYKMLPPICKRPEDGGGPKKGKPCTLPPDERTGMLLRQQ
ncbi:MAG: heavy-metal-associated domain-containing protein [Ilyomonas sp.]